MLARKNKPTEVRSKTIIFENHREPAFGDKRLDAIDVGEVARFRGKLINKKLGEKRINNILRVLSNALRYALDCELIAKVPKLGLFTVERRGTSSSTRVSLSLQRRKARRGTRASPNLPTHGVAANEVAPEGKAA